MSKSASVWRTIFGRRACVRGKARFQLRHDQGVQTLTRHATTVPQRKPLQMPASCSKYKDGATWGLSIWTCNENHALLAEAGVRRTVLGSTNGAGGPSLDRCEFVRVQAARVESQLIGYSGEFLYITKQSSQSSRNFSCRSYD